MTQQHLVDDLLIRMFVPCSRPLTRLTTGAGRGSPAEFVQHSAEPVRGYAHHDDVGAVGGLREISCCGESFGQFCFVAQVAQLVRWFLLMSSAVSCERTHCSVGPRRGNPWMPRWCPRSHPERRLWVLDGLMSWRSGGIAVDRCSPEVRQGHPGTGR